jgi:CheY-like chemotaxis protein
MYVDDDDALVLLTTRLLERLGYRVTAHSNATDALMDFRARPAEFDVVITDGSMPGLSGLGLIRELLATRPELSVVLASGSICTEDAECARRLGVRAVIEKPETIDDLGRALHGVLAQ